MSQYFFNLWSIPYLIAFVLLFIVVSIFIAKLSNILIPIEGVVNKLFTRKEESKESATS
ncbi:MAG: hypothetical protein HeimAB125_17820 [Candidatus Heimdallarchaeota archaeon AB_125]|nr:MAG: hypothetical protein HeimAB125_17820 [Candidatus Heimdallarchaeota archaeon AB_125]